MACINAIREVDKKHIIVVESNEWGKKIHTLRTEIFDDPQVMPSLHHYPRQFAPFDVLKEYPGMHEGKHYGKAELFATLKGTFDKSYIDRPYYCGEFNHGQMPLLDDLLSLFEEHDIHWTLWSYKSLRMGLAFPKESTPWQKFQATEAYKATREGYMKCSGEFVESLKKACPLMSEGDIRHFMGQAMHHWHGVMLPKVVGLLKDVSMADLEAMARSFSFANCDIDMARTEILKKHCR
jgi:hypothetical protein